MGKRYFKCGICGKAIDRNYNSINENIPRCFECQMAKEDAEFYEQYDNSHYYDTHGNLLHGLN